MYFSHIAISRQEITNLWDHGGGPEPGPLVPLGHPFTTTRPLPLISDWLCVDLNRVTENNFVLFIHLFWDVITLRYFILCHRMRTKRCFLIVHVNINQQAHLFEVVIFRFPWDFNECLKVDFDIIVMGKYVGIFGFKMTMPEYDRRPQRC